MPIVHRRLPVRSSRRLALVARHARAGRPAPGPGRRRRGRHGVRTGEPGHPADGAVRGGARPRRRPHRVHAGRTGHGPVHAARLGPLGRRRRRRRSSCRRAGSRGPRCATPRRPRPTRRRRGRLGRLRRRPARAVDPSTRARGRHRELGRHERRAHLRPRRGRRPGRPAPRGLRLPAVLGAGRQLDPPRLGEDLDRRLLRRRRGRQGQPPEAGRERLDRRSAGAAGPARG